MHRVERAGQRLLGELALGREAARTYATPLGPADRTPERVRVALAELRNPVRRLAHEVWARVPVHDGNTQPPREIEWSIGARVLGLSGR